MNNEREKPNIDKWITISEHVDIETGEMIKPNIFKLNYYKIRYEKSTEFREQYTNGKRERIGVTKYLNIGRPNRQQKLWGR